MKDNINYSQSMSIYKIKMGDDNKRAKPNTVHRIGNNGNVRDSSDCGCLAKLCFVIDQEFPWP